MNILSVGIDIGTSTTSLIFSRLKVANTAGYFSVPSVEIVDKEILYQSPVYRTPLVDASLIDGDSIQKILEKEYKKAGILPEQVETGAVIITGESARKENSSMILQKLSRFAGDFVVSTAGPDLESVIAGQGSGARQFSEESGAVVANIDIGGGTANVVVFDSGEVVGRGCLDVGGRQVTVDPDGRIAYISKSAGKAAKYLHLDIHEGDEGKEELLKQLCAGMNRALEQMLGAAQGDELLTRMMTGGASSLKRFRERPIRHLFFSGGVADCIYDPGKETFCYGDIGVLLAQAIRDGRLFSDFQVMKAKETIRATVIGAGTCTTSISGSTVSLVDDLLPLRNVPVLRLSAEEEKSCWEGESRRLSEKMSWFLKQNDTFQMALALKGKQDPGYAEMKRLSEALAAAASASLSEKAPLLLIVEKDMAKALGMLLRQRLAGQRAVIAIDEIKVEDHHYVDLGKPIMDGLVIPVVVKTLIFG